MSQVKWCDHCKMDTAIRNPSGFCDHLYYPDCCEVCKAAKYIPDLFLTILASLGLFQPVNTSPSEIDKLRAESAQLREEVKRLEKELSWTILEHVMDKESPGYQLTEARKQLVSQSLLLENWWLLKNKGMSRWRRMLFGKTIKRSPSPHPTEGE